MAELHGHLHDLGVLDLTTVKSPEELQHIEEISDVGAILVPEHLVGALTGLNIYDVGSIVPVPEGGHVQIQTGQTTLSGESLAAGDPETILIITGQVIITPPVEKVGYKELRIVGQLIAPRGSEALSAKLTQHTGQAIYYNNASEARLVFTSESWDAAFLELLPTPVTFVVFGSVTIEQDVTVELLREKVAEIVVFGKIRTPKALLPLVKVLSPQRFGKLEEY